MSKSAKKKATPKKKEASTKKKEKKKRGSEKKEEAARRELETKETMEPTTRERLEAEASGNIEEEAVKSEEKREAPELGEEERPVEAPVEEAPVVSEEEETEEEEDEGLEIVEEKFYDLNLRRIWTAPRLKRTPRAVRYVKDFVAKRMKSDMVSMSEETNQILWARGISKPPRHLRLRVVKDKDDRVIIFPAETAAESPMNPRTVQEEAEPKEAQSPKQVK